MRAGFVVWYRGGVCRPTVLSVRDGRRPVTLGGVLFLTTSDRDEPSIFPTAQSASAAIERTVAYRHGRGLDDHVDFYVVVPQRAGGDEERASARHVRRLLR